MLETEVGLDTGLPGPVVLRALTTADAVAFAGHVAADLPRLAEHLPWPDPTSTPDGAADWLGLYERQEDGRVGVGGVWAGDALVGGALLFHHQPDDGIVEIGCWLTAPAEGAGVAAAACTVLVGVARAELAAERVEWHASTVNTGPAVWPSGSASSTRARCARTTSSVASASTQTSSRWSVPSSTRS